MTPLCCITRNCQNSVRKKLLVPVIFGRKIWVTPNVKLGKARLPNSIRRLVAQHWSIYWQSGIGGNIRELQVTFFSLQAYLESVK